jgi:hypothetical protein
LSAGWQRIVRSSSVFDMTVHSKTELDHLTNLSFQPTILFSIRRHRHARCIKVPRCSLRRMFFAICAQCWNETFITQWTCCSVLVFSTFNMQKLWEVHPMPTSKFYSDKKPKMKFWILFVLALVHISSSGASRKSEMVCMFFQRFHSPSNFSQLQELNPHFYFPDRWKEAHT